MLSNRTEPTMQNPLNGLLQNKTKRRLKNGSCVWRHAAGVESGGQDADRVRQVEAGRGQQTGEA